MLKLFDKILASRIKEVFNNHVEEYNPNDWKDMRAKLREKSHAKTIYLFPFIAKAASVVLFMGLSIFYVNKSGYIPDKNKSFGLNEQNDKDSVANYSLIQSQNTYISQIKRLKTENPENIKSDSLFSNNTIKSDSTELNLLTERNYYLPSDSSKLILADIKNVLKKHHESIHKMDSSGIKSNSNKILPIENNQEIAEESEKKQKNFAFGVELTSVSNYAAESNGTSLNVGGGISAGYKLSKNFGLSTGLTIAKQSLNYQGSVSRNFGSLNKSAFAYDNTLNIIDANSAKSNLSFVAFDIPMNIEFSFKQFNIYAGVSSLLFVNETYSYSYQMSTSTMSYDYQNSSIESQNSTQNVSNDEKKDGFGRFDFAKLLNFSVAYNFILLKGNFAFEPYVKLPLAGISSKDMKMGSGGIALKYSF